MSVTNLIPLSLAISSHMLETVYGSLPMGRLDGCCSCGAAGADRAAPSGAGQLTTFQCSKRQLCTREVIKMRLDI